MIFSFRYRDADYQFNDERMGLGEARWIKSEVGMIGPEFFQAVQKLDADAIACLVVLAMRRAGVTDATIEDICNDENGYFEVIETIKVDETTEKAKTRTAPRRRPVAAVKD